MNFALSSHVLMAHWVPGFLVVMAVRPVLLNSSSTVLKSIVGLGNSGETVTVLAVAVAAFFIGEVLDASRDLLEHIWDLAQPVNWAFLGTAEKDKVENFRVSYFTYYVFDCNVSLALAILLVLSCFTAASVVTLVILTIFFTVFVTNAILIRREMVPVTNTK